MLPKERLHAAVRGLPHDRVPVTPIVMMFAAHHIGRTYRDYYLNGRVLAEAQIAVARDFATDQVSAISDPWREAEGLGMQLDYPPEGVGIPRQPLIGSRADVRRLQAPAIEAAPRMADRVRGVAEMVRRVGHTHSVLGWVEGALAEYVDLRGMEDAMLDLLDEPAVFHEAAKVLAENGVNFARAQVQAGADMIGIGDAAASLVGPELYAEHVLPYEKQVIDAVHDAGALVKLHICGNTNQIMADMARTGADVIDVDWMVPLAEARQKVGEGVTLCGNFDPAGVLLQGTPQTIAAAAQRCVAEGGQRFILMPGCEVPPGTPEANLRAFCPGDGCLIGEALTVKR
jgi:MtaA/CmuA family methyltransferase